MKRRVDIISVCAFVAALFALFVLLSPRMVQKMQSGFLGMIAPFLKQGSNLERQLAALREGVKTLSHLQEENKRLFVQNQELSATNQTLRGLESENNRLRNALGYRERSKFELMPARIIARDASSWYNTVKIDRGSGEGLEPDLPVLTEKGLVGKTQVTSEHAASVILLSDENCRVAALVEGTQEQGIVHGDRTSNAGVPLVGLYFLSKDANLQPGQKVYTSGIGGVFPKGVAIGTIKEFKVRELDGYATLIPEVDLSSLQDVFVVVGEKK
jgi:rod shape-determining protein MreC